MIPSALPTSAAATNPTHGIMRAARPAAVQCAPAPASAKPLPPISLIAAASDIPLSEVIFEMIPWLEQSVPTDVTARVGFAVLSGRYRLVTRFSRGVLKSFGRRTRWGRAGLTCDVLIEWKDEEALTDWVQRRLPLPVQVLFGQVTIAGSWLIAIAAGEVLHLAEAAARSKHLPSKARLMLAREKLQAEKRRAFERVEAQLKQFRRLPWVVRVLVRHLCSIRQVGFFLLSLGMLLYCRYLWLVTARERQVAEIAYRVASALHLAISAYMSSLATQTNCSSCAVDLRSLSPMDMAAWVHAIFWLLGSLALGYTADIQYLLLHAALTSSAAPHEVLERLGENLDNEESSKSEPTNGPVLPWLAMPAVAKWPGGIKGEPLTAGVIFDRVKGGILNLLPKVKEPRYFGRNSSSSQNAAVQIATAEQPAPPSPPPPPALQPDVEQAEPPPPARGSFALVRSPGSAAVEVVRHARAHASRLVERSSLDALQLKFSRLLSHAERLRDLIACWWAKHAMLAGACCFFIGAAGLVWREAVASATLAEVSVTVILQMSIPVFVCMGVGMMVGASTHGALRANFGQGTRHVRESFLFRIGGACTCLRPQVSTDFLAGLRILALYVYGCLFVAMLTAARDMTYANLLSKLSAAISSHWHSMFSNVAAQLLCAAGITLAAGSEHTSSPKPTPCLDRCVFVNPEPGNPNMPLPILMLHDLMSRKRHDLINIVRRTSSTSGGVHSNVLL